MRSFLLFVVPLAAALVTALDTAANPTAKHETYVGNDACRPCHAAIAASFAQTAMARTSGPAAGNVLSGRFTHSPSRVEYEVIDGTAGPELKFRRHDNSLEGSVPLSYSVGSNTRGRTYLFTVDGFLFQSPINYYAQRKVWDMSPGYQAERELPLNHPVTRTCLFCHASQVQQTSPGTENHFAGAPFLQSGVGCERCHGPGSAHVERPSDAQLVVPTRLAPEARDSVCTQCHLEGASRIARAGRSIYDYRPGERFSDVATTFVAATSKEVSLGAVSQVEALATSRCLRESGGRMSCTSCHDPHRAIPSGERAGYYRQRCLTCHAPLATGHHESTPDCTGCHMPRRDSADISHTQVTDHRIMRRPVTAHESTDSGNFRLVPFSATTPDARSLGLAYAETVARGGSFGASEAVRLLEQTVRDGDADGPVFMRLAFLVQQRGDVARAEQLYHEALAADATDPAAAANLGVILARRGAVSKAIGLWTSTFARYPHLGDVGIDLAEAQCLAGDEPAARRTLDRVLRYEPDLPAARAFAKRLCGSD